MQRFFDLLDEYNAALGDARAAVETRIRATYGRRAAVFVLDMSRFSLATRTHGILHYLGMIRRMQITTAPLVVASGGEVVKFEADNLFAIFPGVPAAVEAAIAINRVLAAGNTKVEDSRAVQVGVGIAWGDILLVPGQDYFGDTVNLACKLGEDLAREGEILLDAAAQGEIAGSTAYATDRVDFAISGLDLAAYRIGY
ncbi:MAG: adenylate/guanylate cyclase domain-containing protein [Alphaproteobacteria bacterium]|nr:adenylate/guanylate cyclase domain-containing protein [Alphaproteobacteria bacterium]